MGSDPEIESVRPGEALDWEALESFLRQQLTLPCDSMTVVQFGRGAGNLTYRLSFGGEHLVLRRPPFGWIPTLGHDMSREYRVMSAVGDVFTKVPAVKLYSADQSVIGSSFFIIEYRPGVVARDALPPAFLHMPGAALDMSMAVVDTLAELHMLSVNSARISDLGRPDGYVERQVRGWAGRWTDVRPNNSCIAYDAIPTALLARIPSPQRASVIHNDFKLNNCQFALSTPSQVQSVFDWDMGTIGDPLCDLAIALMYWPPSNGDFDIGFSYSPGLDRMGLFSQADFRARYVEQTGLDLEQMDWYEAYACWRTAVLLYQLQYRYSRGESHDDRMSGMVKRAAPLMARAASLALGV